MKKLSLRALNRATLARQMLLRRAAVTPLAAIERLVGVQAQAPRPPFVGLWSRVQGFRAEDLTRPILRRQVVRGTLMRGTLHAVSRRDYVRFRRTLQPMLTAAVRAIARNRLTGVDPASALAEARAWFEERPRTFDALRQHMVQQFPSVDTGALAYLVRMELPLLQVPAAGERWAYPARAAFAVAESWLDAPLNDTEAVDALMLRYLAAFGPASAADAQTWSGMTGLARVLDRLRSKLEVFKDERGRELFDLPNAPRPAPDEDAPPRFLPEWENLLLSHADRSRVIADEHRPLIATVNLRLPGTLLVDGFVAGLWVATRKKQLATLEVRTVKSLPRLERGAVEKEGESLLRFLEPDAVDYAIELRTL
jgi:hypothetical protein